MSDDRLLLIGCGILSREIRWLVDRNHWPVESVFLTSSLHSNPRRLASCLADALDRNPDRDTFVCYGCCHPMMDEILTAAGTFRTEGQNCAEMLLGHDAFTEELAAGAYFLLESWAHNWRRIITATFGSADLAVVREIFHLDRTYLLALRTPISHDFSAAAEEAGRMVDLPVRWRDVSLDHLEAVLAAAIERASHAVQGTGPGGTTRTAGGARVLP